jgi:hypothetical protein
VAQESRDRGNRTEFAVFAVDSKGHSAAAVVRAGKGMELCELV